MKARARNAVTTLVLLAVAGGVVAYAYYGVQKTSEKEAEKAKVAKKLFTFTSKDVTGVTVDRTGTNEKGEKGEKVKLVKSGEDWRIVSPIEVDGDRSTVKSITDHVASLNYETEILPAGAPAADLARYGLDKPSTRLELELGPGKTEGLEIGKTNGFDGSLYVRKPGGPVVQLHSNATKFFVEKSLLDLRDKRILAVSDDKDVKKVEVKGLKVPYAFERDAKGWKLLAPISDRADDGTVSRVLMALRALRADGFVAKPGPDKEYGLDKPRISVRVTTTNDAVQAFEVGGISGSRQAAKKDLTGASQESYYARRLDGKREIATLFQFSLKDLDLDLTALQDKTVLSFDKNLASALHFEAGAGNTIEIQKKTDASGENWSMTSPRAAPAKRFKVNSILYGLAALKGNRIVDASGKNPAQYGLDHPSKAVSVLGADGKELGRVELGKEQGDKVYARGSASPRIFEIDKSRVTELPNSADDMEESTPATATPPAK